MSRLQSLNHYVGWLLMWLFGVVNIPVLAGNWRASINTEISVNNRYQPESQVSSQTRLDYGYWDKPTDWQADLSAVWQTAQQDHLRGQKIYQLSLAKGIDDWDSQVTVGRMQRSDNLGFYFLDGLQWRYQPERYPWEMELYAGKPGRIDDVRSISGDSLIGINGIARFQPSDQTDGILSALTSWDMRLGLQRLSHKADKTSHRVDWASSQEIDFFDCGNRCSAIKSQFLISYHLEKKRWDDLLLDVRIPLDIRVPLGVRVPWWKRSQIRLSYEHYQPDREENPDFREAFFSYYSLGSQKLSKVRWSYEWNPRLSGFTEWLDSRREIGESGNGFHTGLRFKALIPDLDTELSLDQLRLGKEQLNSVYFSAQYHFNSRLNLQWDAVIRKEDKGFRGTNRVYGFSAGLNYMLKNNVLIACEVERVNHSRLRNEYEMLFSFRYFFDRFQPKRAVANGCCD